MSLSGELGTDVIMVRDLLGMECWECSKDAANTIVREHRGEAWRVWLTAECDKYLPADADLIAGIIEKKKAKPGPYLSER